MSEIKWCDTGNHGFPWGVDDDETEFAETRERKGRRRIFHTCGACNRKSAETVTTTALTSAPTKVVDSE